MNIVAIGTGYVGLVTGACFSEHGVNVTCVDVDKDKIESLLNAEIPFYEPGLENLVRRNTKLGKLKFSSDLAGALSDASIAFICVGTPSSADGSADLKYVFKVAEEVAKCGPENLILITKSTVPVGTGDRIESILKELGRTDITVVSNPEFLREGSAVQDCLVPDRVVLGTDSLEARETLTKMYEPFVRSGKPIFKMDRRSAEMTKYGANALLACRISFINEVSRLCERVGANVEDVRRGMGSDARIGMQYLFPSIGFGGSCFPKDVRALQFLAKEMGMDPHLLNATLEGNEHQKENFVQKLVQHFGGASSLKGKKIAIWGISFKAKTDDIRESPSLFVIDRLLEMGASVTAHDPEGMPNAQKMYGDKVQFVFDMYDACENADGLCVLTEWNTYKSPDFQKVQKLMSNAVLFDGRNLYNQALLEGMDLKYYSIGNK